MTFLQDPRVHLAVDGVSGEHGGGLSLAPGQSPQLGLALLSPRLQVSHPWLQVLSPLAPGFVTPARAYLAPS